jgi:uncharacterized membrane protein SpoIIM required for sporulation
LIFLGTLVAVVFGSFPANCFTSACSTSTSASIQYGILASRILWTLGVFGIAVGAALKLQFVLLEPSSNSSESNARHIDRRRAELYLLIVSIVILLVLTLVQGAVAPLL